MFLGERRYRRRPRRDTCTGTSVVPPPASCNAVEGKAFINGPIASTIKGLDVDTCCDACRRDGTCAVFNLDTTAKPTVCQLLSAQSGQVLKAGSVCGTPSRWA